MTTTTTTTRRRPTCHVPVRLSPLTRRRPHGDVTAAAVALAAADFDAFRSEPPRTDARIGILASLILGGVASIGGVGGLGATVSRQHHAHVAFALLVAAAVALAAGVVMIVRLILPRMDRQLTTQSGGLHQVAALPDAAAARRYYTAAARDCLTHWSGRTWCQSKASTRRLFRLRGAGRVLGIGVLLVLAGVLALAAGW